jgi:hypothetical protein
MPNPFASLNPSESLIPTRRVVMDSESRGVQVGIAARLGFEPCVPSREWRLGREVGARPECWFESIEVACREGRERDCRHFQWWERRLESAAILNGSGTVRRNRIDLGIVWGRFPGRFLLPAVAAARRRAGCSDRAARR